MIISPVFLHQFHEKAERILRRRGNLNPSAPVLEMTVVLDHNICAQELRQYVPALLGALKRGSELFRNVRLNVTDWWDDERIENQVRPMLAVMSAGFYEYDTPQVSEKTEKTERQTAKRIEILYQYLKFYHARSKLIVLITDGCCRTEDEQARQEALKPFLGRKLMRIIVGEKGMELI